MTRPLRRWVMLRFKKSRSLTIFAKFRTSTFREILGDAQSLENLASTVTKRGSEVALDLHLIKRRGPAALDRDRRARAGLVLLRHVERGQVLVELIDQAGARGTYAFFFLRTVDTFA